MSVSQAGGRNPAMPGGGGRFTATALLLACAAGALFLAAVAGCSSLCPEPVPEQVTDCGEVELGWPLCKRLRVAEHSCRRDDQDRLVAYVRFENVTDDTYHAKVRVKFIDADGLYEKGSFGIDMEALDPGETAFEWTSYTHEAVRYRIEVTSGRVFQW